MSEAQEIFEVYPAPEPLLLREIALFLDLDGTLAPIAPRPQDVAPEADLTARLERLEQALGGRLAVISGRTLADVDRILEGRVAAVAAVHGLIRRGTDRVVIQTPPHPALQDAAERLRIFAQSDAGLMVEEKDGRSVALHFRLARDKGPEALRLCRQIAQETGLVLQRGDMVEELRTPGPTKGDSLRDFMADPAFAGVTPVFVGDDRTDEDGFTAAAELGGFGVLVGPPRATAARFGLTDVAATAQWLEASLWGA
ncbi:trehalose-phosphatase [Phenylobacterium immobile]|uniref:trehalose-phosphatase n=1 Tax=Phenylobacterium immobile TaxID=21 RepID=UPI000AA26AA6|nr:trehalose-phosphatase [Phenylobacterium immobile]